MNDIVVIQESPEAAKRANEVKAKLHEVRYALDDQFFTLCELLREAHQNAYHLSYGFNSFELWVENSGLGICPRQAYYYLSIAGKAEKLGLDRTDLAAATVTKLKEIFKLDPVEHGKEMKKLVAAAPKLGLQEIADRVKEIRAKSGKPNLGFYTVKVSSEIKPTIDRALGMARFNYGPVVTPDGQHKQATDSQCLELMAVSYLQDPNNVPQGYSVDDF